MTMQQKMGSLLEMDAEDYAPSPRGSRASTSGGGSSGGSAGNGGGGSGGGGNWRDKLQTKLTGGVGQAILIIFVVAAIGFAGWQALGFMKSTDKEMPRIPIMHETTGEFRWYTIAPGEKLPEGYHFVEYCFENQCGPAGGTPVILNSYLGKPGPTKCPTCGAEVVGHNPRPEQYEGVTPAQQRKK